MKLFFVVIDGMGDRPIAALNNRTPLAVAATPHLDHLAQRGKTGLMYTVRKGIAPQSDVGVVSILGYDPVKYPASRGVMEAVGSGVVFNDGDLALRCNFATFDCHRAIIDRRAGRNLTAEETTRLSREINAKVTLNSHPASFEFTNTIGHRAVLVIRGMNTPLSGLITNTDPAYMRMDGMGVVNPNAQRTVQTCEPMEETEAAQLAADLVNEFVAESHTVLQQSAVNQQRHAAGQLCANGILTRDAGHRRPAFFNITDRYNVKFCCITNMPLEVGIAKLMGMNTTHLPRSKGDLEADCRLTVDTLLRVLELYDGFYIHLKGPDEPGHDGDYLRKTELMAIIDKQFFAPLLANRRFHESLFCVTSDHATPCTLKAHSDDPVPLLIAGGTVPSDGTVDFSEAACNNGSLGLLAHGHTLMPYLMKLYHNSTDR
ncbi:MAG: 2,3-bisphosphoglycerate-independent phosphoglycerate mutase [Candidatus Bathyarchaeota archaeon]|nr:MAG: 2,3-bisphosphoglycerate-independent phosphoglycerate mutase [Candidatus Bathyarchaeota archaeon]